jgi:hypothetical protein
MQLGAPDTFLGTKAKAEETRTGTGTGPQVSRSWDAVSAGEVRASLSSRHPPGGERGLPPPHGEGRLRSERRALCPAGAGEGVGVVGPRALES